MNTRVEGFLNSTLSISKGTKTMSAFLDYNVVEKGSELQYPTYEDREETEPNLLTFLDALNQSQPISACQFEVVWSRWPRTMFFAKGVTIPGVSVNTIDINYAGFTIPIPTHVTYETTDIQLTIIADKEGFHYYDLRNMVLQSAHPLVAGDPKSMVGNNYNLGDEDTLDVRLRNSQNDVTHHHWIFHNFRPKSIGDVELEHGSTNFVEFQLTGTFTHISYDCGRNDAKSQKEIAFEEAVANYQNDMDVEETDEEGNDEVQDSFGPIDDEEEEEPEHYPVEDNPYDLSAYMNPDDGESEESEEPEPEENPEEYEDYRE